MDPLSITAAALGFAGVCTCIIKNIKDTISRLQDVPQTLSDLDRGLELMVTVLSEVDRILRSNYDASQRLPQEQRIVALLAGCRNTLERLNLELEGLVGDESWVTRVSTSWREDEISRMLSSLEQEKQSVNVIIGILNMRSIDDTKRSINKMQATIDDLNERLSASIHPSETPIFPAREWVQSPRMDDDQTLVESTPSRESSPSSTEFSFDNKLINTKVYRQALARLSRGKKRRLSSSSEATTTETRRAPLGDVGNSTRGANRKAMGQRKDERPSKKRCGDENWIGYFEDCIGIFEDPET